MQISVTSTNIVFCAVSLLPCDFSFYGVVRFILYLYSIVNLAKVVRAAREEAHLSQAALAEQIGCDERTILNIENDRGNPKFEVLCQIIAYLHIPADRIFHPDTATDGVKKQKLLLMLQECDEQEAAEILPAIEYLLALIHKRGSSND